MFRRLLVGSFAVAIVLPLGADDKKSPPDEKAAMEAMAKYGTPGEFHKKLDPLAGDWTFKASFTMAPGATAFEMTGTATRKWILDGRFLTEDIKSEGSPFPFHGLGVMGYDVGLKKYTSAWWSSEPWGMIHHPPAPHARQIAASETRNACSHHGMRSAAGVRRWNCSDSVRRTRVMAVTAANQIPRRARSPTSHNA